jgi:hypothetical protein
MDARRSLTQAVGDVISDSLDLIQTELRLARTEAGEKISTALSLVATGGAGAILVLLGSILLLLGAVRWLAIAGLPEEWGLLLVGGAVAAGGLVLIIQAKHRADADALIPKRTMRDLQADVDLVKEELS